MQPTTIRLPEELVDELDAEAESTGHSTRASYIRWLLQNRALIAEAARKPREPRSTAPGDLDRAVREILLQLEAESPVDPDPSPSEISQSRDTTTPTYDRSDTEPDTNDVDPSTSDTAEEAIEDALRGWRPGQHPRERDRRREVGKVAATWLSAHDQPATRQEVVRALYEDHPVRDQNEDTWWRKTVRPAFQRLEDAGVAEYQHGRHEYVWTGPDPDR